MKIFKYIPVLAILIIGSACASTSGFAEKRRADKALKQEMVREAIETGKYIVKADRLYARRAARMYLRPSHNFIIVDKDRARINLAYAGRSYASRAISGINFTGRIEEINITPRKKGSTLIAMRVRGGGELFNIYIHSSASGSCKIDINNPKLEMVSYGGQLSAIL